MGFTTNNENERHGSPERARRETKANDCEHSWFTFRPVCTGYHVATDTEYTVQGCRGCDTRRDVDLDTGETFREYLAFVPREDVVVEPEAEHYEPRFDGIDAFNEAEDTSEPTNLFDNRGGYLGIGD